MLLLPESPVGQPSFNLAEDELATALDLLCRGAADARAYLSPGMHEVPITIQVRKAMLRVKRQLSLTNLEVGGEHEILNPEDSSSSVEGRIDITLRFLQQFGNEDEYLGVECKRLRTGDSTLSGRYVSEGVDRFVTGQYAAGHSWGMMLGYVLTVPAGTLASDLDSRIQKKYGEQAALSDMETHECALSMHIGQLAQGTAGHIIQLMHILVDMSPAAPLVDAAGAGA